MLMPSPNHGTHTHTDDDDADDDDDDDDDDAFTCGRLAFLNGCLDHDIVRVSLIRFSRYLRALYISVLC